MDAGFWNQRWATGQIGFHEGRANRFLEQFADRLPSGGRVLVPLCGKAYDLVFLARRGHPVVGVELVPEAVATFFAEHDLTPSRELVDGLVVDRAGGVTIITGDWFATRPAHVGAIDAVYDRAALIALPPPMRDAYARHLRALAPAAPVLLVTLEYPQAAMDGPPFAVLEDEVRRHHADRAIEPIADLPVTQGRLAALGITARERGYWIA